MPKKKQTPKQANTKPDVRKRADMEKYLSEHGRYATASIKDEATSYANRLDLASITGPKASDDEAVKALAASIAKGEYVCEEWDTMLIEMLQGFTAKYGYMPGFAGPDAEWLVLRKAEKNSDTGEVTVYPNASVDKDADYAAMPIAELRERAKLVIAFDELCDDVRRQFINVVLTGHLFERPLTRRKKERFFSVCDLDQFLTDNPGISHVYTVPDELT